MSDEKEKKKLKKSFIKLEKVYIEEIRNNDIDSSLYMADLFEYKGEFSRTEICLKMTDRFFDMIDRFEILLIRPSDFPQILDLVPKKFLTEDFFRYAVEKKEKRIKYVPPEILEQVLERACQKICVNDRISSERNPFFSKLNGELI